MPTVEKILEHMERNPEGVRFSHVLKAAEHFFGPPRIHGSHFIFRNVWSVDPRIVLQAQGAQAKTYQVKQLLKAINEAQFLTGEKDDV